MKFEEWKSLNRMSSQEIAEMFHKATANLRESLQLNQRLKAELDILRNQVDYWKRKYDASVRKTES